MADVKISELTALTSPDGAEELVVNDSGTTKKITIEDLFAGDNVKAKFGASDDLQIYHDGSNSYIDDGGTGDLYLRGSNAVRISSADGSEKTAVFNVDGAVNLYHNNVKKLATTSTGVALTGDADVSVDLNLGGNFVYTGSSQIQSTAQTGNIVLSGGNNSNNGANITAYGPSHSSLPSVTRFRSGGTETMRISADGNLGLGAVPEAWHSVWSATRIGDGASLTGRSDVSSADLGSNFYINATADFKAIDTSGASRHYMYNGAHYFYVDPPSSAGRTISWNTGFEVLNDGKARAKNGLLFGTDTAAVNTLDDYEEGTWTPSITRSGISIGSYAARYGRYTKIGNQVTLFCKVQSSNVSGGSGAWTCTGLPFAPTGIDANTYVSRNYMDADTNDRDFRIVSNVARLFITSADNTYNNSAGYVIWTFTSTFQVA